MTDDSQIRVQLLELRASLAEQALHVTRQVREIGSKLDRILHELASFRAEFNSRKDDH